MSGKLLSRNVTIAGRRTSLRLEEDMWAALTEICEREDVTLHALCSEIDKRRGGGSRTSTVRSFIVGYYRDAATEAGHSRAGHGRKAAQRRKTGDGTAAGGRLEALVSTCFSP
jgi:predicted DNA-binding ribbon-helix-helix protein